MSKTLKLILCILLPLSVGAIGGIATSAGVKDWYITLNKPDFNPPNYLFGPVWTFLYILMGITLYQIVECQKSNLRAAAIIIFSIQLFLNLCWSFIFFKYQLLGLAFVEIITLWLAILLLILVLYKIKPSFAYLQIPYVLWVSFASILNLSIWFLN